MSSKKEEKYKDKNKDKKNKECNCCCIEGIFEELKMRIGHVVTVYTKHNQNFSRRIHKVNSDILVLEDVPSPFPTYIVIPLCEISIFVYEDPSL
ncbi:hypothetical protein [Peribacillus asahii]|uniref:hypothetical protein n=1 Tax=Peribacillus asahii TaxID=228899 RepID=UPI00207A1FD2|nr:hypothetical protein [Peribacillus asahii]USK70720.1 hypothetical protein LIS76_02715 [Peribacillus asahii]